MKLADYLKTGISRWPNWLNLLLLRCNIFGKYSYGMGYVKAIRQIDKINPEERLLEIVNYAIKHVEYYRKRYQGQKITSLDDFEKIICPIDKKEVMEHWNEFVTDNIDWDKCVTGTTGGTSGKPTKLVLPQNRYIHSLAFWHKELKWYGWNYDARAVIRNHRLTEGRDYMVNPILKEFIFDAFRMNADYTYKVWKVMHKHKVGYIHAYPSGAYQFLKFCINQKLDMSFVKLCILTSEEVTEEQRYFIEKQLGIRIYTSYGHSEKLIMAGTCPDSIYYHMEPCYGYGELLDAEGKVIRDCNKTGELVGTTFINKYFPLIRYRTGDFTSYAKNIGLVPNNSYRLLNNIQGHWDKSLVYRSDGTYTTLTALNLHGNIYEHIDGLQYLQEKKGELIVMLIPNKKYTEADTLLLKSYYENAMGKDAKIEFRFVNKLKFQPNGKFLPLINRVTEL